MTKLPQCEVALEASKLGARLDGDWNIIVHMSTFPLIIPDESNILVAGAGGGFDFLCGLPIILELESQGHKVHIANYSFTNLKEVRQGEWHSDYLLEITDQSRLETGDYFPELHLSKWYQQKKSLKRSVWCFAQAGVEPTLESYNYLIKKYAIDTVICMDGGVDGIFRGDEFDLGTPSMDSISVISTSLSDAKSRIYACTAFGTEGAESQVSHAQALNRMSELMQQDAFLGVGTIRKNTESGAEFIDAVESIFQNLSPVRRSIIISTITASMRGIYGKVVVHEKTHCNPPWISPLTSLIWFFEADKVAQMKLFYNDAKNSTTVSDVASAIEKVRSQCAIQPFESIPI